MELMRWGWMWHHSWMLWGEWDVIQSLEEIYHQRMLKGADQIHRLILISRGRMDFLNWIVVRFLTAGVMSLKFKSKLSMTHRQCLGCRVGCPMIVTAVRSCGGREDDFARYALPWSSCGSFNFGRIKLLAQFPKWKRKSLEGPDTWKKN